MAYNDTTQLNSLNDTAVRGEICRMPGWEVPLTAFSSGESLPILPKEGPTMNESKVGLRRDHPEVLASGSGSEWHSRSSGDDYDARVPGMFLRLGLCLVMGLVFATATGSPRRTGKASPGSAAIHDKAVREYARFGQHLANHPEIMREIQIRQQQVIPREPRQIATQTTRATSDVPEAGP